MHVALRHLTLLCLLSACQEPFGVARQDLVGDRIVTVTVRSDGPSRVTARTALVSEGALYADEPAALDWFWATSLDTAAEQTVVPEATGPVASLRLDPSRPVLGVLATFPSGSTHRAAIALPGQRDADTPDSLGIDDPVVAADDVIGLLLPSPVRSRFMTVGGRGTVRETTVQSADLVVAEVVYDDGEEEQRTPTPEGVLQVFGLALGDGNAWRVEDLWVGAPPDGVFLDDGRFLPSDVPVGSGPVEVRLGLDDDAPWGLRIEQTRPPEGATPLDLDRLVTQEVLRSELVGAWRAVVVP